MLAVVGGFCWWDVEDGDSRAGEVLSESLKEVARWQFGTATCYRWESLQCVQSVRSNDLRSAASAGMSRRGCECVIGQGEQTTVATENECKVPYIGFDVEL